MDDPETEPAPAESESEASPSDKRLDEQLRRLYEYVLDEPIPKRLLDVLEKGEKSEDDDSSDTESSEGNGRP